MSETETMFETETMLESCWMFRRTKLANLGRRTRSRLVQVYRGIVMVVLHETQFYWLVYLNTKYNHITRTREAIGMAMFSLAVIYALQEDTYLDVICGSHTSDARKELSVPNTRGFTSPRIIIFCFPVDFVIVGLITKNITYEFPCP